MPPTGIHATDITRLPQELVAKGALNQEGQGRWTRYRLPGSAVSVHRNSGLGHSVHKGVDSVRKGVDSGLSDFEIERIASPSRSSQRLSPKEMENIILDLCCGRRLTRRELAGILHRNPDNLRSRFLTPMVGHGLLRLHYPDKPNRVDQAYSAATPEE